MCASLKFAPSPASTHSLTVSTTGNGFGAVASSPGGIACGNGSSSCTASFASGATVYLATDAAAGSNFNGFSGACSGNSCQLTMNSDQTVSGDFEPVPTSSNSIIFSGSVNGSVVDEGEGGCNGGAGGTAPMTGSATLTLVPVTTGGYTYTGTITFTQGAGICDDYAGSYNLAGQLSTISGSSIAFDAGPAFVNGTFTSSTTFSGSWSFSVNIGPDVSSGTISMTAP